MTAFIKKYWPIFLLFIASLFFFENSRAFQLFGTLLYVPVLTFGGILLALGFRSIFNRDTTWPYVQDNNAFRGYDSDFRTMDPESKVWLTAVQFWIYLIFIAIVIHASMG